MCRKLVKAVFCISKVESFYFIIIPKIPTKKV